MKQLFILAVAVVMVFIPRHLPACDVCGCASGGISFGLLPLTQRHFVGARWQGQGYETLPHAGNTGSKSRFASYDLWGRWQPHMRWQIVFAAPYIYTHYKPLEGSAYQGRGLGDLTLSTHFSVLDPRKQSCRAWKHHLQIGAGIKLPTGDTRQLDANGEVLPINLQEGTGSTDALFSGMYALRHGNWGGAADASLRLATSNRDGYRYGNRLNAAIRGFYTVKLGGTALMPYAGLSFDGLGQARDNARWQADTQGWALFSNGGMEVFSGRFSLGLSWQAPLAHVLAGGDVIPKQRWSVSCAYLFGRKIQK